MLADEPKDSFLRYALALEWAAESKPAQAVAVLDALIQDDAGYIPAYLQAGQLLAKAGDAVRAKAVLQAGVAAARAGHDDHAAEEMTALLESL